MIVVDGRRHDLDPQMPHDPQVLRCPPPGRVDVVRGDVLQIARDRVEAQPAARVAIREPDATARAEDSAGLRKRDERLQAASLRAKVDHHPPGIVVRRDGHATASFSQAAAARRCAGSIWCAASDSW